MNSSSASAPARLTRATSGFVLAATVTILFNTALAWAKDANPSLNNFMKSVAGHHWTTHGLADLAVFAGLGIGFARSGFAEKLSPDRLIGTLIGAVVIAALGLVLWFALF